MAKTVDNFSTIEEFRKTYNELAFDVGDISGLRDALKSGNNDTLVDAVNVLEDKQFFFQEFVYAVGTGGVTAGQASFSGADAFGNSLIYKDEKIQVFKNAEHLRENIDYIVSGPTGTGSFETIVLQGDYANGQSKQMASGDQLIIYSFTGAFIGTDIQGEVSSFFQKTAENTIFNTNANGVILNGDNSSVTQTLESGFTLQLAGKTFAEDDVISTVSGKKVQFPILSDGTLSITGGSLTGAVNGTFSGTVQAEQLTSTDDLTVSDDASIGGNLSVTGNASINGNTTLGDNASDTITFTGKAASNLRPDTNNAYSLGLSTLKWSNVHATTFTGNLSGNVTGNITGDILSSGGQTIVDNGSNGTDATARLSSIKSPSDGTTTVLDVATGALTGTVSSLSNHTTANLTEGSNLYFTNARADARIAAASIADLSDVGSISGASAGQILAFDGNGDLVVADNSTTTDSTSEGTNKYFTDERVNDVIVAGNGLAKVFVDDPDGSGDTSLDGRTTLSVNTSNGVKIDGDDVELDYSVISDSDLTGGLPDGSSKDVGHLFFLV
tara:strand:+ start:10 stop:1674 length:1665 start_codon:yes stop_codon:yes gene_type:complete